jgi:WD40 repeat protein
MQVWSVANGQLTATFHDTDDPTSNIGTLAWSPDGKYLAESYSDIHIWDVNANKLVATFGKVTTKQGIYALAWSPDGKMLASSVQNNAGGDPRPNTMNVWQLS